MSIKEAIAEFKKATATPERFDVYMLGHITGTATSWCHTEDEEQVLFYDFYPRAPKGIFPIGNIAVDYAEGEVYLFEENKEQEVDIDFDSAVNLIEAISKEL